MKQVTSAGRLLQLHTLSHAKPVCIAVVGCGGKTTFVTKLAYEMQEQKVLITPTSKILPLHAPDIVQCTTLEEVTQHIAQPGIQCIGIQNHSTGKLEALPETLRTQLIPQYSIVLSEADGSRSLPCKGWKWDEPCVPLDYNHTVGIITLQGLFQKADAQTVFRIPAFLKLTGLSLGDEITLDHLEAMVCGEHGMFQHAQGKQSLFINQVEHTETAQIAQQWLLSIARRYPYRFHVLAYGSAIKNQWVEVVNP